MSAAVIDGHLADELRYAFRTHPAGVAVITADPGTGPVGLTATSVSSVSTDPPAVAFSLSAASSSAPLIRQASTVVIHLIDATEQHLGARFAASGIDRFEDPASWRTLPTGEPVLTEARVWLRGRISNTVDVGGSAVVVAEIIESGCSTGISREPLVYCDRRWHRLGDDDRKASS